MVTGKIYKKLWFNFVSLLLKDNRSQPNFEDMVLVLQTVLPDFNDLEEYITLYRPPHLKFSQQSIEKALNPVSRVKFPPPIDSDMEMEQKSDSEDEDKKESVFFPLKLDKRPSHMTLLRRFSTSNAVRPSRGIPKLSRLSHFNNEQPQVVEQKVEEAEKEHIEPINLPLPQKMKFKFRIPVLPAIPPEEQEKEKPPNDVQIEDDIGVYNEPGKFSSEAAEELVTSEKEAKTPEPMEISWSKREEPELAKDESLLHSTPIASDEKAEEKAMPKLKIRFKPMGDQPSPAPPPPPPVVEEPPVAEEEPVISPAKSPEPAIKRSPIENVVSEEVQREEEEEVEEREIGEDLRTVGPSIVSPPPPISPVALNLKNTSNSTFNSFSPPVHEVSEEKHETSAATFSEASPPPVEKSPTKQSFSNEEFEQEEEDTAVNPYEISPPIRPFQLSPVETVQEKEPSPVREPTPPPAPKLGLGLKLKIKIGAPASNPPPVEEPPKQVSDW